MENQERLFLEKQDIRAIREVIRRMRRDDQWPLFQDLLFSEDDNEYDLKLHLALSEGIEKGVFRDLDWSQENEGVYSQPIIPSTGVLAVVIKELASANLKSEEQLKRIRLFEQKVSRKSTDIYMMKDEHTGCIKIGRSKNPSTRERTLQSENPSIVMIGHWPGTYGDEARLHQMYAHKRVRGEWFRLSKADIRVVRVYCETMKPNAK